MDACPLHTRPPFPVLVHALSESELQARLEQCAHVPPAYFLDDEDEPAAVELSRVAPQEAQDRPASPSRWYRALVVALWMCASVALTLGAWQMLSVQQKLTAVTQALRDLRHILEFYNKTA